MTGGTQQKISITQYTDGFHVSRWSSSDIWEDLRSLKSRDPFPPDFLQSSRSWAAGRMYVKKVIISPEIDF